MAIYICFQAIWSSLRINEVIIECCSFWVKNIGSGATFVVQFIHLHSTVHVSVLDKKLMKKNCNETCSEKCLLWRCFKFCKFLVFLLRSTGHVIYIELIRNNIEEIISR